METCKNNSVAKYMSKQAMGSTTPGNIMVQIVTSDKEHLRTLVRTTAPPIELSGNYQLI